MQACDINIDVPAMLDPNGSLILCEALDAAQAVIPRLLLRASRPCSSRRQTDGGLGETAWASLIARYLGWNACQGQVWESLTDPVLDGFPQHIEFGLCL